MMRRQDLPRNLTIEATGKGARLPAHPEDVILLTKRHASSDQLEQEPLLAFPHRYLLKLGPVPNSPRPLVPVKPAKRQAYLSLASIILGKNPTEATARAIKFLVALCTDNTPQDVPPLPWFEGEVQEDLIDTKAPSALIRLCPVMKFSAKLRD
ncbi:Uncharacterized protein SCF082_LOCUS29633 [Durusdinium trenchii]|uniref:Uncharacterized protein n=1 Tax=Durusdinium trenchii TaxID=1381693 RepID=A0ABP0MV57_9DINO